MILKINGIDKSEKVIWKSLRIRDCLNEMVNTCYFEMNCLEGEIEVNVNDIIEVWYESNLIFKGRVVRIQRASQGAKLERVKVECCDFTSDLQNILVIERFEDTTAQAIVEYLISNYAPDFTTNNVDCSREVKSIVFNRLSLADALTKLAKQVGYYWYVDYEKDIHFFAKNDKSAPFELKDDNDSYIYNSLDFKIDGSEIKNKIYLKGGEIVGEQRTEYFTGDGKKKTFSLANKFKDKPTVKVDGVEKNVGVDFLDNEEDFDCFWNFNQKYIRFKTAPASGSEIEVSGNPLFPIIVMKQNESSISKYGVREAYFEDENIKSKEEAKQIVSILLEKFSEPPVRGMFRTYKFGLASGQTLRIQSANRNLSLEVLIEEVKMSMLNEKDPVWEVSFSSI